jgi:uncharacterized membrane protein YidH (DUF202 family)
MGRWHQYLDVNVSPGLHAGFATVRTPGAYADLSHVIAVITVIMAVMALVRLRPALRRMRGKSYVVSVRARWTEFLGR